MHMVRQMVQNDGGRGEVEERVLPKPTVPDALLTGQADCTWVFPAWEGVEAELRGTPLRLFRLLDYGIPNLCTPVLFALARTVAAQRERVEAFLRATQRGFELAAAQPQWAAELLVEAGLGDRRFLERSQREASRSYRGAEPWGYLDPETWATYGRYLYHHGFIRNRRGEVGAEPVWHEMVGKG
jgi:ABC-type nitrate/sulfonate/bicarbonate transport system substrate-binding protein